MRIALVHDWLFQMRGGEKVLEHFCRMFPDAAIYTLFFRPQRLSPTLANRTVRSSWLNFLPNIERYYRYLLPLFPAAIRSVTIPPDVDVVLSASHCVAKAIPVPRGARHICYCHTPMRYIWHQRDLYFPPSLQESPLWEVLGRVVEELRRWDVETARNVDTFVANSQTVRERIRRCYGRDAWVIYPPVDLRRYRPTGEPREDYYLCVSAFVPYKRVDLAIRACERLGRPLVVVGDGPDAQRLRALAGPWTRFVGWVEEDELIRFYSRCRAVLFPPLEDFGLVPVEAQACGAPVICYGRGGATETVVPPESGMGPTGIWFEDQTVEALAEAIQRFERMEGWFDPKVLRANASRFSVERFEEAFRRVVRGERPGPQRLAA